MSIALSSVRLFILYIFLTMIPFCLVCELLGVILKEACIRVMVIQ